MTLSNELKIRDDKTLLTMLLTILKILLRATVILIMTVTINFTDFTKGMMNLKRCD